MRNNKRWMWRTCGGAGDTSDPIWEQMEAVDGMLTKRFLRLVNVRYRHRMGARFYSRRVRRMAGK